MVEHSVEVGVLARVEPPVAVGVFLDGLEEQVRFAAPRVVAVVAVGARDGLREAAAVDVERDGHAALQVDEIHGVAWQVGVAEAPSALTPGEVGDVDRRLEADGDRRERAPAVEAVELGSQPALHA